MAVDSRLFSLTPSSSIATDQIIQFFTNASPLKSPHVRDQAKINFLYQYTASAPEAERLIKAITNFHAEIMKNPITREEKLHHLHRLCEAYFVFEDKGDDVLRDGFKSLTSNWVNFNKHNKRDLKTAVLEIYKVEPQQERNSAPAA